MKNLCLILCYCLFLGSCLSNTESASTSSKASDGETQQKSIMLSFEDLDKRFQTKAENIYVYNFWATWCKPCVKELPYFEQLGKEYADKNVKVILVSLDEISLEQKVLDFAKKKDLQSEVLLLDAGNPNDWIDKISEDWTGAIPATLIIAPAKNHRSFHQRDFDYASLEALVEPLL